MQEVTENVIPEIPPEEVPAAETPPDYSQNLLDIHTDLQGIQAVLDSMHTLLSQAPADGSTQESSTQIPDFTVMESSLTDIQTRLADKIYLEEFTQLMEKLDAATAELVRINEREDVRDEEKKAEMEKALEAEAELEEAETVPEELPAEPEETVLDYTENLQLLADSLSDVNTHLDNLIVYQQNQQNIQIPILCGVSLCFGGILAVILSNYLKH